MRRFDIRTPLEERHVESVLRFVHHFRVNERVAEHRGGHERTSTADHAARGDRDVTDLVVRAVARLAERGAELQFVDLARNHLEWIHEAIAGRVLGIRIELLAVAVCRAAVGANTEGDRQLFVHADDLFIEVHGLVAELLNLFRIRIVRRRGRRNATRRQQAARADLVAVGELRLVRAANSRLRRVQPLPRRCERPHPVDALVDETAVVGEDLRRPEEPVGRFELEEARCVLRALELEAVHTADVRDLHRVLRRGKSGVIDADVARLAPRVFVVREVGHEVEWIDRARPAAIHEHLDRPTRRLVDRVEVEDRRRVAQRVHRTDA